MINSLKFKVAVGAFVILAAVISVVGSAIYWWTEGELHQRLEDSLRQAAFSVASHVTLEGNFLELYHDKLAQVEAGEEFVFLQVLNRRGGVIYGEKIEYPDINYEPAEKPGERFDFRSLDEKEIVLLDLTFAPIDEYSTGENPQTDYLARVIVARDLRELQGTLDGLRHTIAGAVLLGALGGAGLLALLAYLAVRPIDRLALAIKGIDQERLGPSIEIPGIPSETVPVVNEINTLMARLRLAFDRERTFTSNVAHELRTPLTGLRSTLEVELAGEASAESALRTQETCLQIVRQTQNLVEKLLRLTRLESVPSQEEMQTIDVSEAIIDSWNLFAELAKSRGIQVEMKLGDDFTVNVMVDLFLVVLNNLFENAANYCSEGGTIVIEVSEDTDKGMVVKVINSVIDLKSAEVDNLFDAFWRKDTSRSETGVHAGLGLSISRAMAKQFGAELTAGLIGPDEALLEFRLFISRR